MKQKTIRKHAAKRLKRNIGKAIGIFGITVFVNLCVLLVNQVFVVLFDTNFFNKNFGIDWTIPSVLATVCTLAISFLVFIPFRLNVKKWYIGLTKMNAPFYEAFSYFGSFLTYIRAVWYGLVKGIAQIFIWFVLLIPAMILAVALKMQANVSQQMGALYAMLFLGMCVFALLAIFYGIYFALGFFFADYLFAKDTKQNPFRIIGLSMKIAKHQKGKLLLLYLSLFPFLLLCLFIIPIIVLIPYMKINLAFYANEAIKEYKVKSEYVAKLNNGRTGHKDVDIKKSKKSRD